MADVEPMPARPVQHSTTSERPGLDVSEKKGELSRSASFTYLSGVSKESPTQLKRTFSDNVLFLPPSKGGAVSEGMQSANKELFRRASKKAKKRMSGAKFTLSPADDEDDTRNPNGDAAEPKGLTRSVTGTIRSLARKSWIPTSRSISPAPPSEEPSLEKKRSWSPAKKAGQLAANSIAVPKPAASRSSSRDSYRSRKDDDDMEKEEPAPIRSLSRLSLKNSSQSSLKKMSRQSSLSSLRSLSSSGRSRKDKHDDKVPPLPTSVSTERLSNLNTDTQKKKDPLWTAFRAIEGEYTTFQSKTSLQKAKVLRIALLPFLVKYQDHPSNNVLRAEDLDRRVVILNKWWTGLLEMLSGRNNQSITGTDRPAFLEAASQIMVRPEWRIPGFPVQAADTPQRPSLGITNSTLSLKSVESDFLVESVHQNVRNIFIQNLLWQMAFVVEKLSMRSAPASLVTFSGKACAYAFFFCPGMADMLVRLWRLVPGTLRRIFAETGIEKADRLDMISKSLTVRFPAPVRSLAVSSQAALTKYIQLKRQVPTGTEHVQWHGPWLVRWSGRDSDLFFVFTKHFHVLVADFLQEDIPVNHRACIPGFIPVHAQILTVLETTVYRQATQNHTDNFPIGQLGSDNPDASATLPMTIANATRSVAENRLVFLLRDILGDRNHEQGIFQDLFTTSFTGVVQAATRKISLYNNDACFVLCDFMEEILPLLSRHYRQDTPFLDWPFWLQVCRQMMQSQNTLTQVRLIAFVYSTWNILISNESRKREFVLDWLLEQQFFDQHFCHWSAMVRHYFFRLLCWRVSRIDGDTTALDFEILETLALRLNRVWAHHQYLAAEADMRNLAMPSSAPCSPAPGRALVIIRTDSQPLPPSAFSTFDKFLSQGLLNQSTPYHKQSSVLSSMPAPDNPQSSSKKRWSLLRNMLQPFGSSPGNTRPGEVTPPQSPAEKAAELGSLDASLQGSGSRPATPPHQAFSFKFSLEFVDARPNLANKNRRIVAPLLPTNAQKLIDERRTSIEGSSDGSARSRPSSSSNTPSKSSTQSSTKPSHVSPRKPVGRDLETARYSGRALAEWQQVLMECRNFYTRRKQEGVPKDSQIETPVMGVESFRMFG